MSSGQDAQAARNARWLTWATVGSVPLLWYLSYRRKRNATDVLITDFDSFLVKRGDIPTGSQPERKTQKERCGGPIEQFFKDVDQRDPADFSTFLKSSGCAASHAATQSTQDDKAQADEKPDPNTARVLVLFGTEYGFSKEIAERMCAKLKETKKYWPVLVDMAEHPEGYDLSKEQAVFVACSTQGDGVPPNEAREFCDWLFAGKAGSLPSLSYSVCALGDRSYTHFCRCGQLIDAALEATGAKRIVARKDVNKEDWHAVNEWMDAVISALAGLTLKTMSQLGVNVDAPSEHSAAHAKKWGKSRPYPSRVVALEPLCKLASKDDKNTIRVEFDLEASELSYLPGDALGIYPLNDAKAVEELLAASGLSRSEEVACPSSRPQEAGPQGQVSKMPLAEVLQRYYDIRSPKPDILGLLWESLPEKLRKQQAAAGTPSEAGQNGTHVVGNGVHVANGNATAAKASDRPSLQALLADESKQEAYFADRHVVDVLIDFKPAKLSTQQLLSVLRPLQPRLYSISSSPLENKTRVQATIAEVKYECLGKDRVGVCSTFVSDRIKVDDRVQVYIHKNPDFRLPEDRSKPIIMVGPGTGLAPFRSFIMQRLMESKEPCGQMVLYFGCRRSDQDYLYGEQLEGWAKQGAITLFTAFSRQQAEKVYVQQRLAESGELVWKLLHKQGGHFYVCGDAGSMAGAVEKQLLKIIESNLGGGAQAAQEYLDQLSKTGRYQRDVWY